MQMGAQAESGGEPPVKVYGTLADSSSKQCSCLRRSKLHRGSEPDVPACEWRGRAVKNDF